MTDDEAGTAAGAATAGATTAEVVESPEAAASATAASAALQRSEDIGGVERFDSASAIRFLEPGRAEWIAGECSDQSAVDGRSVGCCGRGLRCGVGSERVLRAVSEQCG